MIIDLWIMRYRFLIIMSLTALCFVGCGNSSEKKAQISLYLLGITIQGDNQEEVIGKLIEQTDEFDYYDDERTGIKRLVFCGVPFGPTFKTEQMNGVTTIREITLITSYQSKADFEAIKNGISKRLGNPDIEEYEDGTEEMDGRFYGRCAWFKEKCNVTLRNLHNEEGGLVVTLLAS